MKIMMEEFEVHNVLEVGKCLCFNVIFFLAIISSLLKLFFSCPSLFHHSPHSRQKVTLILCHHNFYKGNLILRILFCSINDKYTWLWHARSFDIGIVIVP